MPKDAAFSFITQPDAREKLLKSFDRISRAYTELLSGYGKSAEDVLNETVRVSSYDGIVTVDNISFFTICEHHFLPFFGTASISYKPNKIITGIGKISRLVRDVHARRLQIQEIMAKNICEDIMRVLDAKGARAILRARHLCMCSRGPSDTNAETEVIYSTGDI